MHNFNLATMSAELLFNAMPIELLHYPVPPRVSPARPASDPLRHRSTPTILQAAVLWGSWYVLVAWTYLRIGGAVLYPFIDPTLPRSLLFHVALLVALALFFLIGQLISTVAMLAPDALRVVAVCVGSAAIMRVRRPRDDVHSEQRLV